MCLRGELARIETKDFLELQGLLFEPGKKSSKAIIHVHGWTGNFYENKFLEFIAKEAVLKGFAFLTFNTRGAGHVQEFIRQKGSKPECVKIGGSLEKFEDCLTDIEAAINFLEKRGFDRFVLQGHSTGCQKAAFYMLKTKDRRAKGLILLEPTDDPSVSRRFLGNRYQEAMEIARKMVKEGKENAPMPEWLPFGVMLSAQKFLSMSDPNSAEGELFNYSGELKKAGQIDCPVLAIFGENTEYQEKPGEKLELLKEKMQNCETKLFENTNHWFYGREAQLAKTICQWAESII